MGSDMTIGKQPCQDFKAQLDGNEYGMWDNLHECWCKRGGELCGGSVSFCDNCHKDHHGGGYETCSCAVKETLPNGASPGNNTTTMSNQSTTKE